MSSPRLLDRPVFVIGCNRSGTTLLFRTLSDHPAVWSNYEELQELYWEVAPVDPELGERVPDPAGPAERRTLAQGLFAEAHNREAFQDHPFLRHLPLSLLRKRLARLYKRPPIRLIDKTPANCLRIPLLASAFPRARFIFLVRRAEAVISSLMEGWKYWTRSDDDGEWRYGRWHYLAPPGWTDQRRKPLQEICAFQWVEANRTALADLEAYCPDRYVLVRHEDLLADPSARYRELLDFCDFPDSPYFETRVDSLGERFYTHGTSAPRAGKWQALHGEEVESVRPLFQPLMDRLYPD